MYYHIYSEMKRVYSFKLDEELYEGMKKYPHINWSEVIREAIRKRLLEEDRRRIGYAVKLHMEILNRVQPSDTDVTEIIRRFRDER